VLICEDDELTSDYLEHHLSAGGYDVVRTSDGEAALACIRQRLPTVIILDIMLPGICGIQVLRQIRADIETHKVPIMMLTSRKSEQDVVEALELGASDYLTKPIMIAEVLGRVSRLITPYEHPLESSRLSKDRTLVVASRLDARCRSCDGAPLEERGDPQNAATADADH
jgi:two-component system phosphate regulon response regulator PhoB